jgi:hypothetical protein
MAAVGFVNQQMLRAPKLQLLSTPLLVYKKIGRVSDCCRWQNEKLQFAFYDSCKRIPALRTLTNSRKKQEDEDLCQKA